MMNILQPTQENLEKLSIGDEVKCVLFMHQDWPMFVKATVQSIGDEVIVETAIPIYKSIENQEWKTVFNLSDFTLWFIL